MKCMLLASLLIGIAVPAEANFPSYLKNPNVQHPKLALGNKQEASVDIERNLDEAFELLELTGREDEVIQLMDEVLEIIENDRAYFYRGRAKQDLNNEKEALIDFNKAIQINPKIDFYFYARARAKSALNDKAGAIEDYRKNVELDPTDANGLGNLAWDLHRLDQSEEAIGILDQALKVDPNHSNNYAMRGNIKYWLKDNRGALDDFDKALAIPAKIADEKAWRSGVHGDAYYDRGWVKFETEGVSSACEDWTKGREIGNANANKSFNSYCISKELDDENNDKKDEDVDSPSGYEDLSLEEAWESGKSAGYAMGKISMLCAIEDVTDFESNDDLKKGALYLINQPYNELVAEFSPTTVKNIIDGFIEVFPNCSTILPQATN